MNNLTAFLPYSTAGLSVLVAIIAFVWGKGSFVRKNFLIGMIWLALAQGFHGLAAVAVSPAGVLRWEEWSLISQAFLPGTWLLFSLSFARSNYDEIIRAWKPAVLGLILLPPVLASVFREHLFSRMNDFPESNPVVIPLGWSGYGVYLLSLIGAVMILMNLEATMRASAGSKRWQIKFMLLGLAALFGMQVYITSQTLLYSSLSRTLIPLESVSVFLADSLILVSLARQRVLNVEIHISRSVLYNSFTVLAVGGYLLGVGVLARWVHSQAGSAALNLGAFVIFAALLALSAVLFSDRVRHNTKRFISRNLQAHRFDYRKEWMTFTERTSSLLDVRDLASTVVRMISETFSAPSVSLWLFDETRNEFSPGGSTALTEAEMRAVRLSESGQKLLLDYLIEKRAPVDFGAASDEKALNVMKENPALFESGRVQVCACLLSGQSLMGMLTLGKRLSNEPLAVEDLDLLNTLAAQSAGSLLNLRLSRQLLKAKEAEAFQTLSAFFIHDLKNLASMLSLLLQNIPANYEDPAFRKDAFRVISESVSKMNAMCGRLSLLTRRLELQPEETDLNALVAATLADLNGSMKVPLRQDLHPLPKVSLDPEQIKKVLVNLVLNAGESVEGCGEIRVATDRADGWAVLAVSDNGCGMSKEFIEGSLFQPFQTTKSRGMGIGLFHSKRIIEAHQGRIEVESESGKGSTFRVWLPVEGAGGRGRIKKWRE